MADFVSKSVVKSAERVLTTPFASKEAMNTIISDIISGNPWGCTAYESAGESHPAVSKTSEYYSGTVVYENTEGKQVGKISVKAPKSGSLDTNISTILGNTTISTAMGGTASHDSSEDSFSVTLKCHASNGELYNVTFKRDKLTLTSYEADSIPTAIDTWADTIPALA